MEPPNCESCNDEHDIAQTCLQGWIRDDLSVKPASKIFWIESCIVCGSAASALEMWRDAAAGQKG